MAILARQTAQLRRFGGPRFVSTESDLFARHIQALWRRAGRPAPAAGPAGDPEVDAQVAIRF